MRALTWFLLLFVLAMLLALFMGNNQAVVTLYWSPQQAIDVSFNLVLLLLAGGLVLGYMVLRSVAGLLDLPRQARRWRAQQKERAMHAQLLDAVSHFLAGRFARARKAAEQALSQEASLHAIAEDAHGADAARAAMPCRMQVQALAHYLLAESSQSLQELPLRDSHFEAAMQAAAQMQGGAAAETSEGIQLRAARWAIEDRNPALALQRLDALPQGAARRILALRHRLKAARLLERNDLALETARTLARHKAFSADAGAVLVARLRIGQIQMAADQAQLEQTWQSLDADERHNPEIALHATQRLQALDGPAQQAREWLLPVWQQYADRPVNLLPAQQDRLVATLETGMDSMDAAWLGRIEEAHQRFPNQPVLQYLMGMACLKRQLWGKAQQLLLQFTKSRHAQPALQRTAWRALAMLAEQRGDEAEAHKAWKQAALVD